MQMNPGNFSVSVENFVCFSDDHHTQVFYFNCKFERRKDPRQKGDWPQTLTQEEITLNKESKIFLVKSFQGTVRRAT